jgi:hypothetical protein
MLNDYHVLYLGQKDGAEVSNAINKYVWVLFFHPLNV